MSRRGVRLSSITCLACLTLLSACASQKPYGTENSLSLAPGMRQVWAVAPAVDLSGQRVDPILQADLLFEQLQQVRGLVVIPVNRTVEAMMALNIDRISSPADAARICRTLGADALVVPTISIHDPYDPPKFGASLQLFSAVDAPQALDVQVLSRAATDQVAAMPAPRFVQAVGMYDASNGSTRQALRAYAAGRHDPNGPLRWREYLLSMDRFSGFVYHDLTAQLVAQVARLHLSQGVRDADKT